MFEHESSSISYSSKGPIQCASYCVNTGGFACNSFDYCDVDKSCHLSKLHTEDGPTMSSSAVCDHYSSKFFTTESCFIDINIKHTTFNICYKDQFVSNTVSV